jgi:uncharacterized protein
MYPDPHELAAIAAAEKLMTETMARYDPSHDAYHGQHYTLPQLFIDSRVNQSSVCDEQPYL